MIAEGLSVAPLLLLEGGGVGFAIAIVLLWAMLGALLAAPATTFAIVAIWYPIWSKRPGRGPPSAGAIAATVGALPLAAAIWALVSPDTFHMRAGLDLVLDGIVLTALVAIVLASLHPTSSWRRALHLGGPWHPAGWFVLAAAIGGTVLVFLWGRGEAEFTMAAWLATIWVLVVARTADVFVRRTDPVHVTLPTCVGYVAMAHIALGAIAGAVLFGVMPLAMGTS